jgi:hypothetical protein
MELLKRRVQSETQPTAAMSYARSPGPEPTSSTVRDSVHLFVLWPNRKRSSVEACHHLMNERKRRYFYLYLIDCLAGLTDFNVPCQIRAALILYDQQGISQGWGIFSL